MNTSNRNIKFQKYKKMGFSFLYLFILFVTTFHHHPIDFAKSKSLLKTIPSTTSHHSLTADECAIVNFSQKGFNSTITQCISTDITFQNKKQIECVERTTIKKRDCYSLTLRGPPNYII